MYSTLLLSSVTSTNGASTCTSNSGDHREGVDIHDKKCRRRVKYAFCQRALQRRMCKYMFQTSTRTYIVYCMISVLHSKKVNHAEHSIVYNEYDIRATPCRKISRQSPQHCEDLVHVFAILTSLVRAAENRLLDANQNPRPSTTTW